MSVCKILKSNYPVIEQDFTLVTLLGSRKGTPREDEELMWRHSWRREAVGLCHFLWFCLFPIGWFTYKALAFFVAVSSTSTFLRACTGLDISDESNQIVSVVNRFFIMLVQCHGEI